MSRSYDPYSSRNPKRFFRSRDDSVIAGVCGGIAERFGWEPILVRVLTVLLTMFMMGPVAIIAYIVIWMITPRAPLGYGGFSDEEDAFWRGVSDRPRANISILPRFRSPDARSARPRPDAARPRRSVAGRDPG